MPTSFIFIFYMIFQRPVTRQSFIHTHGDAILRKQRHEWGLYDKYEYLNSAKDQAEKESILAISIPGTHRALFLILDIQLPTQINVHMWISRKIVA